MRNKTGTNSQSFCYGHKPWLILLTYYSGILVYKLQWQHHNGSKHDLRLVLLYMKAWFDLYRFLYVIHALFFAGGEGLVRVLFTILSLRRASLMVIRPSGETEVQESPTPMIVVK